MNSETIQVIAVVLLLSLIIWPDIVLQVVGFLLILSAPFDMLSRVLTVDALPIWTSFVVGLVLIGLGRISYHIKLVTKIVSAANPDVLPQSPRKRLGF